MSINIKLALLYNNPFNDHFHIGYGTRNLLRDANDQDKRTIIKNLQKNKLISVFGEDFWNQPFLDYPFIIAEAINTSVIPNYIFDSDGCIQYSIESLANVIYKHVKGYLMDIFIILDIAKRTYHRVNQERYVFFAFNLLHLYTLDNKDALLNPFTREFVMKAVNYFNLACYKYSVLKLFTMHITLSNVDIMDYIKLMPEAKVRQVINFFWSKSPYEPLSEYETHLMLSNKQKPQTIFSSQEYTDYKNKTRHIMLDYIIKNDPSDIKLMGQIFKSMPHKDRLTLPNKYHKFLYEAISKNGWKSRNEQFNCKLLCSLKIPMTEQVLLQMCSVVKTDASILTLCDHFRKCNVTISNKMAIIQILQTDPAKIHLCNKYAYANRTDLFNWLEQIKGETDNVKLAVLIHNASVLTYDDINLVSSNNDKKILLKIIAENMSKINYVHKFRCGIELNNYAYYNLLLQMILETETIIEADVPDEEYCCACIANLNSTGISKCQHVCLCYACMKDLLDQDKVLTCPLCRQESREFFIKSVY